MRLSIYVVGVVAMAMKVLALPTRRLRRPGSLVEISSDKPKTASSEMAFQETENSFSEMIRLLDESAMYSISMSMSSAATGAPPTNVPTTLAPVTAPPSNIPPTTIPPTLPPVNPVEPTPAPVAPTTVPPTLPPVNPVEPTPSPVTPTTVPPTLPPVQPVAPTTVPPTLPPTLPPVNSGSESPSGSPPASSDGNSIYPTDSPSSSPSKFSDVRDDEIEVKCGVTPLERSRDILSILSVISNPVDLVTPGTSQFQARDWLDNKDRAVICATDPAHVGQRYRAALLYYALGGPGWANCRAWADDETNMTPCLEEDVRNSRRLQEDLMNNKSFDWKEMANNRRRRRSTTRHLQGAATPEKFAEEESVRWLSANNECEWFGMDCGDAFQPGDPNDAYYPLVNIDLGTNDLEGALIQEIFGFVELQALFLDGNAKISGTIPEEIGQMTKLKFLDIDDSQVTGPIPNAIYTLTNMLVIDLNANQITGTLSSAVGNLVSLEILQLENNAMTGPLPTESLLNLTRLVALTLEGNLFTGTLEPLCAVRDERRLDYEIYLNFMFAECGGEDPLVECSCCVCY